MVFQTLYGDFECFVMPTSAFAERFCGQPAQNKFHAEIADNSETEQPTSATSLIYTAKAEAAPRETVDSNRYLTLFLDEKYASDRLKIINEIRQHLDNNAIMFIEESLGLHSQPDKDIEIRLGDIKRHLLYQQKFEGDVGRLRNN
jgi:hypothetical protein